MNHDLLRTALRELGDVPPPADLAGSALARARRDHRRRLVAAVAAVVAITALAVAVPVALRPDRAGPPATPAPTSAGPVVAAFTGIGPDPFTAYSLLRDPATSRYVRIGVPDLSPSPDGRRVVVRSGGVEGSPGYPSTFGVADRGALLRDGLTAVRWLDPAVQTVAAPLPRWSPDGTRLAYSSIRKGEDVVRAGVVNAATGRTEATFTIPERCSDCDLSWSADGRELGLVRTNGGVQFYDLTGRPATRWGAPDAVIAPDWWAVSPDRRRFLADRPTGAGQEIMDARTGAFLTPLEGLGTIVGWSGDAALVRVRWADDGLQGSPDAPAHTVVALEIITVDGRVLRRIPVPGEVAAAEVRLG
ncbi:MAG TPA: hypothetical protein VGP36_02320 [Mycobacteriales bacterium]|nr:hypothetical protein [Mycobacteriales bacterium]